MSGLSRRSFLTGITGFPLVRRTVDVRAGKTVLEPARETKVAGCYDFVVAGGGPAGIAAAVTAARAGARTLLLESHGQLGGIWTSGLLSCLIGFGETALDREILDRLRRYGALSERIPGNRRNFIAEPEYMKFVCEELCREAGVEFRLHTHVVSAMCDGRRIQSAITESKSGREAWCAPVFADCTGDGDLGALAGCGYDIGGSEGPTSPEQPASLLSLILLPGGGDPKCIANDPRNFSDGKPTCDAKRELKALLERLGEHPSYGNPTLFRLNGPLFQLMADHQYGIPVDDAAAITAASVNARRELMSIVHALANGGGSPWHGARLIATAEQIGHRRARRLHGLYTMSAEDAIQGRKFPDAVATCRFGFDVHAIHGTANRLLPAGSPIREPVKPYQIPLRACRSSDIDNLLMAGRCLSGDFLAQSSYRITATALSTGIGIGRAATGNTPPG